MRLDDASVVSDQRRERYRFRREQRHAATGMVDDLTVIAALAEMRLIWHPAFENRSEDVGVRRAGEPKRSRAPTSLRARLVIGRVVRRVVAVALEVARVLRRRSDDADDDRRAARLPGVCGRRG